MKSAGLISRRRGHLAHSSAARRRRRKVTFGLVQADGFDSQRLQPRALQADEDEVLAREVKVDDERI